MLRVFISRITMKKFNAVFREAMGSLKEAKKLKYDNSGYTQTMKDINANIAKYSPKMKAKIQPESWVIDEYQLDPDDLENIVDFAEPALGDGIHPAYVEEALRVLGKKLELYDLYDDHDNRVDGYMYKINNIKDLIIYASAVKMIKDAGFPKFE